MVQIAMSPSNKPPEVIEPSFQLTSDPFSVLRKDVNVSMYHLAVADGE